jgi:hypothetical protein
MAKSFVIEGAVNDRFHFRYDTAVDVLYIHSHDGEGRATRGDLTDSGDTRLRDQKTDELLSLTVENFWKRYGGMRPPPGTAGEVVGAMGAVVGMLA